MQPITENELLMLIQSRALRQFNIMQADSGSRFRLHISLKVSQAALVLMGTRNKPREWASLDTLAKHIDTKYGGAPVPIVLSLRGTS
jgi:hypothetical protein